MSPIERKARDLGPQETADVGASSSRFLLKLNDVLWPLADPVEIQARAAQMLGEYLKAGRVGYAEDEGDGESVSVRRHYVNGAPDVHGKYRYSDYSAAHLAEFLAGRTVVRPDIANDPLLSPEEKQAHAVLQLGATISVPLLKEGRLVAVLFAHYCEAHTFNADEIALVQDVAERTWAAVARVRAESELRQSEARHANLLAAIVESSDDAIVSKNLDSIILSWNGGAERLFGYTAAEAVGRSIAFIIPPDRLDEESMILERMRRGERVDHFETIRIRKDGRSLHVSLTISPVKDGAGRIVGVSKIARDITERMHHEKALREANTLLKRANADLQHFTHSASHDLQEPLRMVTAYSQLFQKRFGGQMGEEGDRFIDYIVLGAKRMENLLDGLRAYTRISTAEYETPDEIDAGEALNKALLNLEIAIKDSNASITVSALPRVRMERFQLEQVFQNLIGNALSFRTEEAPRVLIAAEEQGEEWVFSVQDNGIGIEAEDTEEIFGLFKRLHNSSAHAGSGMGLAICRRIVERAGGRIWLESEPGKGSTFYFSVPDTQA
jgi:PAS domain S-box-containing protein